jgi:hypothetical protein
VPVNKKWIGHVPGNNPLVLTTTAHFHLLQVFQVIKKMNTSASAEVGWLENPEVFGTGLSTLG